MENKKEMCITKEEYITILTDIQSVKQRIDNEVVPFLEELKQYNEEIHQIVAGNGNPEKGLTFRVTVLERAILLLEGKIKKLNEEKEEVRNKVWDVTRPLLTKLIEYGGIGLLLWLASRFIE